MIRWTRKSFNDLLKISNYIAQDNLEVSKKIVSLIYDAINQIEKFPKIGRKGIVENTRELIIPRLPYIVVYREKDFVEILRILHTKQKWP